MMPGFAQDYMPGLQGLFHPPFIWTLAAFNSGFHTTKNYQNAQRPIEVQSSFLWRIHLQKTQCFPHEKYVKSFRIFPEKHAKFQLVHRLTPWAFYSARPI